MKLTDKLSPRLSMIFLIAIVAFGLLLTYMVVQAKKISDNWQKTNDQAIQAMEAE